MKPTLDYIAFLLEWRSNALLTCSFFVLQEQGISDRNNEVAVLLYQFFLMYKFFLTYKFCLFCSNDESATETILKSYQLYANVCGILNLTTPRDAFITSLCKAALPPHYTLTVLNPHSGTAQVSYVKMPTSGSQSLSESQGGDHRGVGKSLSGSGETGSGAVVTGIPLGSSHGPVSVSGVSSSVVLKFNKQYHSVFQIIANCYYFN